MKSFLTLSLIAFCSYTITNAQSKSIALRVNYQFTHVDDTTQRDQPRTAMMYLYLGPNTSVYLRDAEEGSEFYFHKQDGGKDAEFNVLTRLDRVGSYIHNFDSKTSIFTERILTKFYQIKEPLALIDWELHEEFKEVLGYSVQKATANVRGRKYTAWFCTDLPFRSGPWKLQGLPGLILEASDEKQDIHFVLTKIEPWDKPEVKITVPKNLEMQSLNQTEYSKLYSGFIANPAAFARAIFGESARTGVAVGGSSKPAKTFNNPIER